MATRLLLRANVNIRLIGDWDTLDPSGTVIPTGTGQGIIMGVSDRLVENLAYESAEL